MDHAAGRVLALGVSLALAATAPSAGQDAINLGATGGVIRDVTGDGKLVFGDGSSAALWGLEITDLAAAQDLLIGRGASCVVVTQTETAVTVDCTIGPKSRAVGTGRDWINLLVWLPELGMARMICNAQDVTRGVELHQNNRFYRCDPGTVPLREPPSPPNAPPTGLY